MFTDLYDQRSVTVDRRADIWAFGAEIYEMFTGRRPFGAADITDTIVAVVSRDPDRSALHGQVGKVGCAAIAIALTLWSAPSAQQPADSTLRQFYDGHRWFELRDAIAGRQVPSIYAGAVAAAFNRVDKAQQLLTRAIREASTADAANDARDVLANMYLRLGRSSDAVRILDDMIAAAPSREDLREGREVFASFRRIPNQTARTGRRRPFQCSVSLMGVFLPVVVNGKPVEWLMDTAFSHSAMTESEARMLGVAAQGPTTAATDFAGGTAAMRTAVAARMTIGDAELRNVPVLVFPDSQPPWNEYPAGKRGAIGLPVVAALQSIGWTRQGWCQVGPNPSRGGTNLAFDGGTPVTRARLSGKPVDLVLDTGNQGGTQLWERFARDFPEEMNQGSRSTKRVHRSAAQRTVRLSRFRRFVSASVVSRVSCSLRRCSRNRSATTSSMETSASTC